MLQRRLFLIVCVLTAVFGSPREGRAGIVEVIIEMSGPKMYGFSFDCRLRLDGTWDSCKGSVAGAALEAVSGPRTPRWWLSLTGGYFYSADATLHGQDYERGEVKMWMFDPMLELESKSWKTKECPTNSPANCERLRLQFYHGVVGWSFNRLWGDGFSSFSNTGLKFRPFGIVVPIGKIGRADLGADFSYDLRLYSRRFTAEDFGRVPVEPEGSGVEPVHALVFGVRIKILPDGTP